MTKYNLSSTKLNEIQNHDDFQVVWCSLDNPDSTELTNFADYVKIYNSFETCNYHIKEFRSERKIFLVLTDFFDRVNYFNDLPQIQLIYILEKTPQNVKYSKRVKIFTDEHELIERLRHDVLLTYTNDLPISILHLDEIKINQSLMTLQNNTNLFLWNLLFNYYLVNAPVIDKDKLQQDMIEQCRLEYKNNQKQLDAIDDFEMNCRSDNFEMNCRSDNVLLWYTEDSFVYRLVNRAFRTRNINLICKFRYFIRLLHEKLKDLSIEQGQTNSLTVYRGQCLSENDLENLKSNKDHLMSMNTFLSTTSKSDVACGFISDAKVGVIFEINITNASHNILHPFADISKLSTKPLENEILFSAGAVFHIDSVEELSDSLWIIKLTLANKMVEQAEQLMDGVREQLAYIINSDQLFMKINDWRMFGKYYKILTGKSFSWEDLITNETNINFYYLSIVFGNYEKAIEYYKELLFNEKFIDHPKRIILNIIIGYNYSYLLEYDNALFYYDIALSSLDDQNMLKGQIYIHIGDRWRATNDFESALLNYEKGLKILIDHNVDERDLALIYRKISDIQKNQNNYESAIIYEEQANQIDQHYMQRSDLDTENSLEYFQNQLNTQLDISPFQRAGILYSMGLCLMKRSDYSQALKTLLEAKELFENQPPSLDNFVPTFSTLYDSIALVYLLLKDEFNALLMLKKSIDIRISLSF